MCRGGGWHPLDAEAARNLASMMAQFNSRSLSGMRRIHMTLFLWSRLSDERGGGTPCFRVGGRTVARACGVTHKAVRAYLESMEADGWLVRVGEAGRGQTQAYTFAWLLEDAECAPAGAHPVPKSPAKRAHGCAPGPEEKGTQHSAHSTYGATVAPPPGAAGGDARGTAEEEAVGRHVEDYYASRPTADEIGVPDWMRG